MSILKIYKVESPTTIESIENYYYYLNDFFHRTVVWYKYSKKKDNIDVAQDVLEKVRSFPLAHLFYTRTIDSMVRAAQEAVNMRPVPTDLPGYMELSLDSVRNCRTTITDQSVIQDRYGFIYINDRLPKLNRQHHVYLRRNYYGNYDLILTDDNIDQFGYTESKMLIGDEAIFVAKRVMKEHWSSFNEQNWMWDGKGTLSDRITVRTEFFSGEPRWDGCLDIRDGQVESASCSGGEDAEDALWHEKGIMKMGEDLIKHGIWNIHITMEGND